MSATPKPLEVLLYEPGQVVQTRDGAARILDVRYTDLGTCVLLVELLETRETSSAGEVRSYFADSLVG